MVLFSLCQITTKNNSQWKVLLEEKVEYSWPTDYDHRSSYTLNNEDRYEVLSILQQTGNCILSQTKPV